MILWSAQKATLMVSGLIPWFTVIQNPTNLQVFDLIYILKNRGPQNSRNFQIQTPFESRWKNNEKKLATTKPVKEDLIP